MSQSSSLGTLLLVPGQVISWVKQICLSRRLPCVHRLLVLASYHSFIIRVPSFEAPWFPFE
jgi:hypothetical protein